MMPEGATPCGRPQHGYAALPFINELNARRKMGLFCAKQKPDSDQTNLASEEGDELFIFPFNYFLLNNIVLPD
jgi:hypothetical protein